MEYITFNDLMSASGVTKEMKQILNYERFGLLPDDVAAAVEEERKQGNYPNPLTPVPLEEFEAFKKMISQPVFAGTEKGGEFLEQDISQLSDMDIANIFYSLERAKDFITDPDNLAEAGAIIGGIGAPTLISGGSGFPVVIGNFINKYPRLAKTLAAFFGGTAGSAGFTDSKLEALGYGAREAAGEGAFQVLQKIFGGTLRKFFRGKDGESLEEGAKSSQKILTNEGGTFTPARLSKDRTIDFIENIADNAFFGTERLRRTGEKGVEGMQEAAGRFLMDMYYPGQAEKNFMNAFRSKASYENVDDLMKNFLLKGKDFYKVAEDSAYKNLNQVSKKYLRNNKIIDTNQMLKAFDRKVKAQGGDINDPSVQALRNYIAGYANTGKGGVDFLTAKNIRSHFLGKTGFYTTAGTTAPKYLNKIAGDMAVWTTNFMDKSVKKAVKDNKLTADQAAEILSAYRGANKIYKTGKETFNTKFVAQLLLDEGTGQTSKQTLDTIDNIYRTVIGTGDRPGRVREFFKLLDKGVKLIDEDTGKAVVTKAQVQQIRNKLQGQFFFDIFKKNTENGIIQGQKVLDILKGKTGPGTKVIDELFKGNKSTLKGMEEYLQGLILAQGRGIKNQKGSLVLASAQFGAVGTLFYLNGGVTPTSTVASLAILAGPAGIARLFSDKRFVDNLLNLEIAKSGSNVYARSMVQVINNLVANEFVDPILAKIFIDDLSINDVFPNPDKTKKELDWYDGVEGDTTSEEADNPAILEVQGKFNQAPPGLLEQLGIDTLDSQPVAVASASETPSIAPLDLGPVITASGPPSQTINPNTLASLESVGLPFFQAKEGGLASVDFKKFKKPQVVS